MDIPSTDAMAQRVKSAIQGGEVEALRVVLEENPELVRARVVDAKGVKRTLLHLAVDWPGHFPRVAEVIRLLLERGADPDAALVGGNAPERPLHSAASSDDVAAIDALLDGGADIESPGAIFTNGAAMSDAVIFAQWKAARRLLERGAKTTLTQAAALGLLDRVVAFVEGAAMPDGEQLTAALWHACRGGQRHCVEYLLGKGANLHWVGWDQMTPLGAAEKSGNRELVAWLRELGARAS